MSPIPLLRPRVVVKTFERLGWQVARGTLRGLLQRARLTIEEFVEAIEE